MKKVNIAFFGFSKHGAQSLMNTVVKKLMACGLKKAVIGIELHIGYRPKKDEPKQFIYVNASLKDYVLVESILKDFSMRKSIRLWVKHENIGQWYEIKPVEARKELAARFN